MEDSSATILHYTISSSVEIPGTFLQAVLK